MSRALVLKCHTVAFRVRILRGGEQLSMGIDEGPKMKGKLRGGRGGGVLCLPKQQLVGPVNKRVSGQREGCKVLGGGGGRHSTAYACGWWDADSMGGCDG